MQVFTNPCKTSGNLKFFSILSIISKNLGIVSIIYLLYIISVQFVNNFPESILSKILTIISRFFMAKFDITSDVKIPL